MSKWTAREDTPGSLGGRALDSSVIVAAFSTWQDNHRAALAAMETADTLVAHALLEAYSVLTRLPDGYRQEPSVVAALLADVQRTRALISLPGIAHRDLIQRCADKRLPGGAIYDAAIGAACAHAKITLLTFDKRASSTYAAVGCDFVLL